jgi:hypothetical protein
MPNLPRIYFDTNERDDSGPNAYSLSIFGARKDIQRLGDSIRPGMRVLLYMADELEVEAILDLLSPLGKPVPNARKYFARICVAELAEDINWLAKATKVISEHWQKKNASRKNKEEASSKDKDEVSMTE